MKTSDTKPSKIKKKKKRGMDRGMTKMPHMPLTPKYMLHGIFWQCKSLRYNNKTYHLIYIIGLSKRYCIQNTKHSLPIAVGQLFYPPKYENAVTTFLNSRYLLLPQDIPVIVNNQSAPLYVEMQYLQHVCLQKQPLNLGLNEVKSKQKRSMCYV